MAVGLLYIILQSDPTCILVSSIEGREVRVGGGQKGMIYDTARPCPPAPPSPTRPIDKVDHLAGHAWHPSINKSLHFRGKEGGMGGEVV